MNNIQLSPANNVVSAELLSKSNKLRLLVLGAPKIGKSTSVISTSPKRILVANSDLLGDSALRSPARETKEFDSMLVSNRSQMEKFLKFAKEEVGKGVYETIIWDPITHFSDRLAEDCEEQDAASNSSGKANGKKYWAEYRKYLTNCVGRLFKLNAHIIVVAHYQTYSWEDESEEKKGVLKTWKPGGPGVVPGLFGRARLDIAGLFNDVVFMEKQGGKRVFVTEDSGVFGPGCRALKGVEVVDANIMTLITEMERE